jgi:hypothetical protein
MEVALRKLQCTAKMLGGLRGGRGPARCRGDWGGGIAAAARMHARPKRMDGGVTHPRTTGKGGRNRR